MMYRTWIFRNRGGSPQIVPISKAFGIFGFNMGQEIDPCRLRAKYKKLVLMHHPDHGGSAENFQTVQQAYRLLKKHDSSKSKKTMSFERSGPHEAGVWNVNLRVNRSVDKIDILMAFFCCCCFYAAIVSREHRIKTLRKQKSRSAPVQKDISSGQWHVWRKN